MSTKPTIQQEEERRQAQAKNDRILSDAAKKAKEQSEEKARKYEAEAAARNAREKKLVEDLARSAKEQKQIKDASKSSENAKQRLVQAFEQSKAGMKTRQLTDARTVGEKNASMLAIQRGANPQESVDQYRKLGRDKFRMGNELKSLEIMRSHPNRRYTEPSGSNTEVIHSYSPSGNNEASPTIYTPFQPYFDSSGGVSMRFGMITIPTGNMATRVLVGTDADPDSWGSNYVQISSVAIPSSGVTSVYVEIVVNNLSFPAYTFVSATSGTEARASHGAVPSTQTSNNVDVSPPNGALEITLKIPLFSIGSDRSIFQWAASNMTIPIIPQSGTNDVIDASGTDTYFFDNGYLDPIP